MKKNPFGPQPKASRPRITVVLHSGTPEEQSVPAEVVAIDEEGDLAALRVTGARNLPAALDATQEAPVAQTLPVYVFGFPMNKAQPLAGYPPITVVKGNISGLRRDVNNELVDIHINGEINPGNSGGPVIDAQGRLVGVAVAAVLGKQIGFIIPAGELNQMFKGRLASGLVLQVKQQGTRIDIVGETWIHDRRSFIRARGTLSVRVADAPKGEKIPTDEYMVLARLADPMLKVSATQAYLSVTENVPGQPDAGGWTKLANTTPIDLKIQDQIAIGNFKLPAGAVPDQTFAFQFSYVNADGKTVFTQPHLVRLTFPKNPMSVTLNITGIPDPSTTRFIEDTASSRFPGKVSVKKKTADSLVLEIDPVPDPKVITPRITFGDVTDIQGRTFAVTGKKIPLPVPNAAEVATALEDLTSTDVKRRGPAADQLAKAYVPLPERRAEVAKALVQLALDRDIWKAKPALRALVIWAGPENIADIIPTTENGFLQGEALDVLARFKEPAAAAAIAKMMLMQGDRSRESAALKAMGPAAEKAVLPIASSQNIFQAKEGCNILAVIGTAECVPALTAIANSNNALTSPAARDALKTVQARLKGS